MHSSEIFHRAAALAGIIAVAVGTAAATTPDARYTFDDADVIGTSAQRDSINGNHTGEPGSSVTTGVQGRISQAYGFAGGSGNRMTVPAGVVPSGADPRTISIWFNQAANTAQQDKIWGYGADTAGKTMDASLEDGGIKIRHFGGNITYGSGFDFDGVDAGWHHLAVRVNASATTFADVDVYLDGSKLPVTATASAGTGQSIDTAPSVFGIGASSVGSGSNGFNGLLDELRVYASALNDAEISSLALSDEDPPTIAGSDIMDDQGGQPVEVGTRVKYVFNFSEEIDANSVSSADFDNAGTSEISFGTIMVVSTGEIALEMIPTTPGTLQIRIPEGATILDLAGNAFTSNPAVLDDTSITVTADTTPPTLAGTDIVDNRSGNPVSINSKVIYTLTFNEDINADSVSFLDFENGGTSTVTFGSISETLPGVFIIEVTPATVGTLRLQISSDATIADTAGHLLNTSPEIADDTLLQVNERPPNMVVFFLDDFGWADWGQDGASTGSAFYETPHMNRLAAEGLYFDHGYASSPVCSPTRGALMTGQAPAFSKLTEWISGKGDSGKPIREAEWIKKLELVKSTFPEVLSLSGYRTIHVGKWHLGTSGTPEADPLNHGFDVNIGGNHTGSPPRYFANTSGFGLPNLGSDVGPSGSYLTDVLTEQVVAQIQSAVTDDVPFVLYFSHYAVHTPIQAPSTTVQKYQDKLADNPGIDWQGHTNPTYAAMIEHVDRSLGEVLSTLENPDGDEGTDDSIAPDTLVVFTSDNGGYDAVTSNRPLREGKGENYEGGIREPWVFWWPGTISPGVSHEPIVTHDLYPTLLSIAGVAVPDGHTVNGQDLSALLEGGSFERQSPLVFHYPHWSPQGGSPYSAVRKGDWKLIYEYHTSSWELYDLSIDIGESTNRINNEQDRHAVLSWMLADGLEQLDANYPRNATSLAEEPPAPLVTPNSDQDGDGHSDLDETIQGTDLNDARSFFAIEGSLYEPNSFTLEFPGAKGRTYSLEASETLAPGSWAEINAVGPLPSDQPTVFTDGPGLLPRRFYRVITGFP